MTYFVSIKIQFVGLVLHEKVFVFTFFHVFLLKKIIFYFFLTNLYRNRNAVRIVIRARVFFE